MHHSIAINEFKLELESGNAQFGSKSSFFGPCDLEIWLTLKNNRAPLLCYFKLCASFRSHQWIQTWVRVRKRSIRVKIIDFLARVTLKFNRWPWKSIGNLSYATSSFVHHFIAISEFELELRVGKRSIRVKIGHFLAPVTLKFYRWPWKTIGHLSCTTSGFVHHFIAISEFKLEFRVRKRSIRVKIIDILARVTLKFDRWPWKTTGHLSYATSSFVHHFMAISEFKLDLESGNTQFGSKFLLTSVTLTFRMDITFGHGNNFWKFHGDTMMET